MNGICLEQMQTQGSSSRVAVGGKPAVYVPIIPLAPAHLLQGYGRPGAFASAKAPQYRCAGTRRA
jgi:hypothetical protein